ncbi:MAG: ribose 5-phosphate isomerase B [candidate division WOR-3 bacterium]
MRVALAADHRGFFLKERIKALVDDLGHDPVDFGADDSEPSDYPDFALVAAEAVSSRKCERGILVCGTGIGMSVAANKVKGIIAARCCSVRDAEICRRHNNANIMTLSAETSPDEVREMVKVFLETPFEGGRHERRVRKIFGYEGK